MSKAAKVAGDFRSRKKYHEPDDLKGLPPNVQEAILDVQKHSQSIHTRVTLAEKLHAVNPEHPYALAPDSHAQSSMAYRFEVVGGEIVEIRKDSHDDPVQVIHRPDLTPADEIDPAAGIEAIIRDEGEHPPEPAAESGE